MWSTLFEAGVVKVVSELTGMCLDSVGQKNQKAPLPSASTVFSSG